MRTLTRVPASRKVRSIIHFYLPLSKAAEEKIWKRQQALREHVDESVVVPDDERVEDAGLNVDEVASKRSRKREIKGSLPMADSTKNVTDEFMLKEYESIATAHFDSQAGLRVSSSGSIWSLPPFQ